MSHANYNLFLHQIVLHSSLGGPRCIFLTVHFTINYNNSDRTTLHFVTNVSFFNSDKFFCYTSPYLLFFLNTFFQNYGTFYLSCSPFWSSCLYFIGENGIQKDPSHFLVSTVSHTVVIQEHAIPAPSILCVNYTR